MFAGRYTLKERLGRGAQGLAIRVEDTLEGDRPAVLKLGLSGEESIDGTIAEFEALRTLTSPYIAPVLQLGFASARDVNEAFTLTGEQETGASLMRPYLVRTWVDGANLVDWAAGGDAAPPTLQARTEALAHLAEAVADLHRHGLVHGDIKPDHVLVTVAGDGDRPMLIDFGLAARGGQGTRGGTPGYLAPERLTGVRATAASDRFALGVVMAQALLGERAPVRCASTPEDLPAALAELEGLSARALQAIRRLLDPDPARRPELESVAAALVSVEEAVQGLRVRSPRKLPFLGVARQDLTHGLLQRVTEDALPPVVFVVGAPGSGRSRVLQKIGWGLQSQGRSTLSVLDARAPWRRLLNLGPQLGSLGGGHFVAPDPQAISGDRARWLRALASALADATPKPGGAQRVALLWDDVGEDVIDGLDAAEAMALLLDQAPGRLRLWATTTEDRLGRLRGIFASVGFEVVTLPLLTRSDLDGLAGPPFDLSHGDLDALYARSGGAPGALVRWMQEDALDSPSSSSSFAWIGALAGLIPGGITRDALDRALAAARIGSSAVLQRCLNSGELVATPPGKDQRGWVYRGRVPSIADLDEAQRLALGRALTEVADRHPHLAILAAALRHDRVALLQAWEEGGARLTSQRSQALVLTVLEPALMLDPQPHLLDAYTEAALESGELQRGRALLEGARTGTGGALAAHIAVAEARLAYAQGDLEGADTLVAGVIDADLPAVQTAHAELVRAQVQLRRGAYQAARALADDAAAALDPKEPAHSTLRAEFWVLAAAASAFMGESEDPATTDALRRALDALNPPPRVRARYHALCAVAAYMRGALDEANDGYRTALEIVERHGLDQDRPLYLLNLGTAYERQVRLSMAREYYDHGIRCCTPSTRPSTRALLLANRANVDIKLGRTAEARELLAAAERIAAEAGLESVRRFVRHLQADAGAVSGALEDAHRIYAGCAEDYRQSGDRRHACELDLKAGLAAVRGGDSRVARGHMAKVEALVDDFPDLKPLASILHAELALARGGIDVLAGVDRYLRALERALEAGDDLTVLTEALPLKRALIRQGDHRDPLAEQELASITARAWRRVALALTPELRQDLARHLELAPLSGPPEPAGFHVPIPTYAAGTQPTVSLIGGATRDLAPQLSGPASLGPSGRPHLTSRPDPQDALEARFYRMLSLNRRILGESDLGRLIPAALDIALELSRAERGFVLLRAEADGGFDVAFSRDVDGRAISPSHLDISETVARQVAVNGTIVETTDAANDQRFGHAVSVHKLQLTSILCVPIRDREAILGCLYLDHRSRPGVFDTSTVKMIAAYADQVAIALVSARHVSSLEHERDDLAAARLQIEALLAEKEELLTDLRTRCDQLEAEVARERTHSRLRYNYDQIIAQAPAMRTVLEQVDRVVDTTLPVVVHGESGTGKELIARAIHFNGAQRTGAFVAINCGAMTETLLESELFGHVKGAFTGASTDRQGLFESASGGTLFLDEVGEMSPVMQVKLLRALQERRIRPVGATREIPVDVRVIAATHRDLISMIDTGEFRQDLYYRLATLVIDLPPLRERHEDIPLLVQHFLTTTCAQTGQPEPHVGGDAVQVLVRYDWPGNIRQLENVVRAAIVLGGDQITGALINSLLSTRPGGAVAASAPGHLPVPLEPTSVGRPPKCTRQQVEDALRRAQGNRRIASELLGVSGRTLHRYVKRFGLG